MQKYCESESFTVTETTCTELVEVSKSPKQKNEKEMKGYVYILNYADGSYYTGSTKAKRIQLHQNGLGATTREGGYLLGWFFLKSFPE